jgi:hypothetical protein
MRLRCAAYAVLLALAACGPSSAASGAHADGARSASCGPHGARTLAASHHARVYALGAEVYGCAVGSVRHYRLGASRRTLRGGRVGPVAVAGRDAAYAISSFGVDTVSAQVIVRNLATGRRLRHAPATSRVLVESFQAVDSIVVKADGAVAWISAEESVISPSRYLEVHRIDARGRAVLDSGSAIGGRSLATLR